MRIELAFLDLSKEDFDNYCTELDLVSTCMAVPYDFDHSTFHAFIRIGPHLVRFVSTKLSREEVEKWRTKKK